MKLENPSTKGEFGTLAEVFGDRQVYDTYVSGWIETRLDVLKRTFNLSQFKTDGYAIFRTMAFGGTCIVGQIEQGRETIGFATTLRGDKVGKIFVFAELPEGLFTIEKIRGEERLRQMPRSWTI